MSDAYVQRLRAIGDELDITRAALALVARNFHSELVSSDPGFAANPLRTLKRASLNIEVTFFVRLAAEFEGILKDHLHTNWPQVAFPARKTDWRVDWFLSRALKQEGITLSPAHRVRLDAVRDYRNSLAHRDAGAAVISFREALSIYNVVVAKLPDPRP